MFCYKDYFKASLFHEPNHKSGKDGRGDFFPFTHDIDDDSKNLEA
jgi:hypothetical protein